MRSSQPRLSVCCLTHGPLTRTAVMLDQLAAVADEIVCAVDATVPAEALSVLEGHADVVVRCHVDRAIGSERNLAWLHSLCTGRWILRIDSDEVVSDGLMRLLPSLVDADDVLQYTIRRRWLYPDPEHVLDAYPWVGDFQLRLVRNEPGLVYFDGQQHTSVEPLSPYRFVDEALLHLDLMVTTPESREAKIQRYELARPGLVTRWGTSMNDYYRPEMIESPPLSELPSADVTRVRHVIDAAGMNDLPAEGRRWHYNSDPSGIRFADRAEVDRAWARRSVSPTAYQARLEMLETVADMQVGERREMLVRVQNRGTETWPWGDRRPHIRLAHRWLDPEDGSVQFEGVRTPLVASVMPGNVALQRMDIVAPDEPGSYTLVVDMVHEGVTWFETGPRFLVNVRRGSAPLQNPMSPTTSGDGRAVPTGFEPVSPP